MKIPSTAHVPTNNSNQTAELTNTRTGDSQETNPSIKISNDANYDEGLLNGIWVPAEEVENEDGEWLLAGESMNRILASVKASLAEEKAMVRTWGDTSLKRFVRERGPWCRLDSFH